MDAKLCRRCIRGYFWQFTLTTLGLGWWGAYSFIFTVHALVENIGWILRTRDLPEGPVGPRRIDHYTTLRWLYGGLFAGFGGICAFIASSSPNAAERDEIAPGALMLAPGVVLLAINLIRVARAHRSRNTRAPGLTR